MRNLFLLTAALLLTAGCSGVQDPWVSGDQQLSEERARSAQQAKDLRERLASVQVDR